MMTHAFGLRRFRILPLGALVAMGGCFATRSDVRVVQTDVASMRMEMVRSDAQIRADLAATTTLLRAAMDSLNQVGARTVSVQGDVRGETRSIREQLLQIQTLLGQSQANINRLRADMEARNNAPPAAVIPPVGAPGVSSVSGAGATGTVMPPEPVSQTGPNQLYQEGRDQLTRGSASTARMLFQKLLLDFPTSDRAPDAQYWIAESHFKEKNYAAADATFGAVLASFPDHPTAATSMFKRGLIKEIENNPTEARRIFTEVTTRYPRSPEADLAAARLKGRP
ncbi:MAG: outer membrane protein assembly factor BamD [Gemmatimonas sp.]